MNLLPLVAFGMVPVVEGKPDNEKKAEPATPPFVDIGIAYAVGGTPSADPEHAVVRKGGVITWHTAPGVTAEFEILPKVAWVEEKGGPALDVLALKSHLNPAQNWQEVKIGAAAVPGTYPYGIRANDITVDPDVVIKPQ